MNKFNKKQNLKNREAVLMNCQSKMKKDYQIESNEYWSLFVDTEEDLKRRANLRELLEKLIHIDDVINK